MKEIIELTVVEFKQHTRLFVNIFYILVFPVMLLLIFGAIYGRYPSSGDSGRRIMDILVPSYFIMVIATTGLMNLPLTISNYRELKILRRFKATPVHPMNILLSQIGVYIFMTFVGISILALTGGFIFSTHYSGNILSLLLALFLSMASIFSMGFVIASLTPDVKSATVVSYLVYYPMLFLTGTMIPIELMPPVIGKIAQFLPVTYAVQLLKGVWLGGNIFNYSVNILVLLSALIIGIGLSVCIFRWE